MKQAIPWSVVGLGLGVALGFVWGSNAKRGLSDAIHTGVENGRLTIALDLKQAAAAGLPDLLRSYL